MIKLLAKIFVERKEDKRSAYGILCGAYGIFLNILLFATKLFAGTISASVAITADALNNLSDAGSSLVSLLGFKIASKKPDPDHPFGHGRIEYISGLIVSFLILLMGFNLGKESILKIINPEPIELNIIAVAILAISILVKFYMAYYNTRIGKKFGSVSMKATAADSISDTISTLLVLISTIIAKYSSVNLDAYVGLLVAAFIFYTGIKSTLDTIKPLLGQPPQEEFVKQIEEIVLSEPNVLGIHDLIVHDYGPGRTYISLHAEVSANSDMLEVHDAIDNIEKQLRTELKTMATLHMDPIQDKDEETLKLKSIVTDIINGIDSTLTIHDFRIVTGPTHTNMIFDVVVPHEYEIPDKELVNLINEKVRKQVENGFCVIEVDKKMT